MTQRSLPWDGHVLGDATLAPYSATEWDDLYESLFGSLADCGVIPGIEGELEVTGAVSPISVDTGRALVLGKFFENTSATTLTINSPVGATRRDWIVLRCCWISTGTCANALHVGTGEVCGPRKIRICHKMNPVEDLTPPALEQSDGNIWEIPLAYIDVTVGGAITVTDLRQFVYGPAWEGFFGVGDFEATTAPPTWDDTDGLWDFATGADQGLFFSLRVPEQFRGHIARAWVYWYAPGLPANTDSADWLIILSACGALSTECYGTETFGASGCFRTEVVPPVVFLKDRLEPDDMVSCQVWRLGSSGAHDDYGFDACVYGVRIKLA